VSRPIPPAQPHGDLVEVLPDVFVVTGSMGMGLARFSRNMVVIREGAGLVVVNSVRLDEAGLAALDALGRVTHVIRIAGGHGSDDRFYRGRYDAPVWAVRGQTYFAGVNPAKDEIYFTPDGFLDVDSELPVSGASLYVFDTVPPEGILRIDAGGGTLIAGDSLQNWAGADRWFNGFGKLSFRLLGFLKPHQLGPGWLKVCEPSAEQVAGLLDLAFENVLPAHGEPVLGEARAKYRPAAGPQGEEPVLGEIFGRDGRASLGQVRGGGDEGEGEPHEHAGEPALAGR